MALPLKNSSSLHDAGAIGVTSHRVFHCGDTVAVGQFDRVLFLIPSAGVRRCPAPLVDRVRAAIAHAYPDGFGRLAIIEKGMMPINLEQQRIVAKELRSYGDQLRCTATVFEEPGFQAAMHRMAYVGIQNLLGRRGRTAAFGDISSALKWMSTRLPLDSVESAKAFIEESRAQLRLMKGEIAR